MRPSFSKSLEKQLPKQPKSTDSKQPRSAVKPVSKSRSKPTDSPQRQSSVSLAFNPNPVQAQFLNSPKRFRVLATAARVGKTTALLQELLRLTLSLANERQESDLFPKSHAWYCVPTYALARPAWRQFKAMLPRELLAKDPNETTVSVELVNGGLIEFRSTERSEGLYGVGLDLSPHSARQKKKCGRSSCG